MKAQFCNSGKDGSIYCDYTQFTLHDVMKHIGVYFIHRVSPLPQVEYLMYYQVDNPRNGNDMVANALGPNCIRHHRHFKSFFCV